MKTLIVIESADELIQLANPNRNEGDKRPFLPPASSKLVFENCLGRVTLEAEGFVLANHVTSEDVIRALVKHVGFKIHIT